MHWISVRCYEIGEIPKKLQYIEDYFPGGSQFLPVYFTIVHYYNGYLYRASF